MKIKAQSSHEQVNSLRDIGMDIDNKNKAVIMGMLRSQIYSDPISSMIREIISNALDAHTRGNKSLEPIDIWVPTDCNNANFIVRDYGDSMSPEVIENVYSKMGSSDKRDSNDELGAFGIGAASPLAYLSNTDSCKFYIETYTEEEDNLMYRKWVQYIDSSQMGMISLLEERFIEGEQKGTKVTVPIHDTDDFDRVASAVVFYCQYLKIKPRIINSNLKLTSPHPVYSGDNWQWNYNTGHSSRAQAIIGGVPYPIDGDIMNQIRDPGLATKVAAYILRQPLDMTFTIGELDLSANREHLQYTTKTITTLVKHLKLVIEEMGIIIARRLEGAGNYFKACCDWASVDSSIRYILDSTGIYNWRGNVLQTNFFPKSQAIDVRLYQYVNKSYSDDTQVLKSQAVNYIIVHPKNKIGVYINDLGVEKIRTSYINLLMDKEGYDLIYVLCPINPKDYKLDIIDKETFDVKSLASIKEEVPKTEKRERVLGQVDGYLLAHNSESRPRASGATSWFNPMKCPRDGAGIYVVFEEGSGNILMGEGLQVGQSKLREALNILGITDLYGFKSSVIHRLGENWIPLNQVLEERLVQLEETVDLQRLVNTYRDREYLPIQKFSHCIPCLLQNTFISQLKPDSLFLQYLNVGKEEVKYEEANTKTSSLLQLSPRILNTQLSPMRLLYKKLVDRYKLLLGLRGNNIRVYRGEDNILISGFAQYINLMDERVDKPKVSIPKRWEEFLCQVK